MRLLIIAFGIFFSTLLFAVTDTFQTHMPDAATHEVEVGLLWAPSTYRADVDGFSLENDISTVGAPVSYSYGLTSGHAIGFSTGYTTLNAKTKLGAFESTTKNKGVDDLILQYEGQFGIKSSSLYYLVGYKTPLEKKTKTVSGPITNLEYEGNSATAQPEIQLQIGYVQPVSAVIWGALLGYDIGLKGEEETKTSSGTTTSNVKKGGGISMTGFIEFENPVRPNFSINYIRRYSTESETGNTTTRSDGSEMIGLGSALTIAMSPQFEVIPSATYSTLIDKNKTNTTYTTANNYSLGVDLRFLF